MRARLAARVRKRKALRPCCAENGHYILPLDARVISPRNRMEMDPETQLEEQVRPTTAIPHDIAFLHGITA